MGSSPLVDHPDLNTRCSCQPFIPTPFSPSLCSRFIPESLRWLIANGKLSRAEALTLRIARWNARHSASPVPSASPVRNASQAPLAEAGGLSPAKEADPQDPVADHEALRREVRRIAAAMRAEEEGEKTKVTLTDLVKNRGVRRSALVLFYIW